MCDCEGMGWGGEGCLTLCSSSLESKHTFRERRSLLFWLMLQDKAWSGMNVCTYAPWWLAVHQVVDGVRMLTYITSVANLSCLVMVKGLLGTPNERTSVVWWPIGKH